MNEYEFLNKFDTLLKEHKIDEAKNFGEDALNDAIKNTNTSLIITILNELIGFYRDLGLNDESYKLSISLEKIITPINNPYLHFISYINIGNSHRASKHFDESHIAFDKAINVYINNNLSFDKEYGALYNNLALLNQCEKDFEKAIINLNKAEDIIKKTDDKIKLATTYVNLSQCYIAIEDINKAYEVIKKAEEIFLNYSNDFHIMGFFHTFAKIYYILKNYKKAEEYYLKALCSIDKNLSRGKQYQETLKEYQKVLKKLKKERIKGLELSFNYFNDFKKILFNNISNHTLENITIGLFGLGSECFNMDDYYSEDHDFNPGFIVLCEEDVSQEEFEKLSDNYMNLPKEYNRFFIRNVLEKHGVHRLNDYLFEYMGIGDINNLSSQSKSLLLNGKIFYRGTNSSFIRLRNKIINDDKHEYLKNIALKTLEISQYIPYNLKRAQDRNENDTYLVLKNHLIDRLIEYYYLYHHKYLPHDKLSLKMMDKNSIVYRWIIECFNGNIPELEINEVLTKNLYELNIIQNKNSIYIDDYREQIIKFIKLDIYKSKLIPKMIEIEWNMFQELNNIGGRAACQNNKPMFTLLREAQYYAWNKEVLDSYYNDLVIAKNNGYNLLAIKYGFMEESVDKEHFEHIKNNLPLLSEKRIKLRESIVSVQLEMLDEYSLNNDISNMRTIYSNTDKYDNASYETYLRGELSSYSENTMFLYAKYITELSKNKQNIVSLTLFYTFLFK